VLQPCCNSIAAAAVWCVWGVLGWDGWMDRVGVGPRHSLLLGVGMGCWVGLGTSLGCITAVRCVRQ
jgi:hypothetical protein